MIALDIISDPVCPWCYIGAAHLFLAMEEQAQPPFAIRWRPFQLNPDMPEGGMDRQEYLATKFGGAARAAEIYARVAEASRAAGLEIDFDAIPRTPNTVDAHRVLHWAEAEGVQSRVAMALFDTYFHKGADIGDHATLAKVAGEAGLDAGVIATLLAGDADREHVREDSRASSEMGVTGVPTFILGGKYALVGAQPVETWEKVLGELAEAATAQG
jgi:predicted DsbA family dithiol-disulfide isomerase